MEIKAAHTADIGDVLSIVTETVSNVYPRYYPAGAAAFFLAHHSSEAIERDIKAGNVWLAVHGGKPVGTVTVSGDEINRLFVLPEHQGKGFGGELLRFAEKMVSKSYGTARLDSSLPAKEMYLKKGYMVIASHSIETENGDFLCYDVMIKRVV